MCFNSKNVQNMLLEQRARQAFAGNFNRARRSAHHQTRAGTHPDEPARMRWRHEDLSSGELGPSVSPSRRSAKLWRARSRLYRSQIFQVNMRLKALAEIYTMHSFAQLCNLNFFNILPKVFLNFAKPGKYINIFNRSN